MIKTVFRYRLAHYRGQILGWGVALALLGLFIGQFYTTMQEQQAQFQQMLESYPQEFLAFFGDSADIATPSGYLSYYHFSMLPLILGIFAVLVGSGLLASDEESGRLDLIVAHPVGRTALFWGRFLALAAATLAILACSWLGLYLPTLWTPLDAGALALAWPYLSLFAVLVLFSALAVLLGMLLPSRRAATSMAGLMLVSSYFMNALSRLNADLETLARLTPLYYYQGGEAIGGLNVAWVVGLLAVALVLALLAAWRFQRRDIRVGGEGGWPSWRRLLRPAQPERGAVSR